MHQDSIPSHPLLYTLTYPLLYTVSVTGTWSRWSATGSWRCDGSGCSSTRRSRRSTRWAARRGFRGGRGHRQIVTAVCLYVCVCVQLRQTVPILQRELQESKSHLTKMQSSSSSSVAGLLQELKAAEDALSRERRYPILSYSIIYPVPLWQ